MRPRHAVLLTPLECAVPSSIPISMLTARVTPLKSALTSRSQVTENTAALSPLECALTRLSPATPLQSALTKNTRGWGRSCPVAWSPAGVLYQAMAPPFPANLQAAFLISLLLCQNLSRTCPRWAIFCPLRYSHETLPFGSPGSMDRCFGSCRFESEPREACAQLASAPVIGRLSRGLLRDGYERRG